MIFLWCLNNDSRQYYKKYNSKTFVRVHQKRNMPREKIEMHQLRCVAVTQLLSPDLKMASSILSLLWSVVGTGLEKRTQMEPPACLLDPIAWEGEGVWGLCCHSQGSRLEGSPGFAKTAWEREADNSSARLRESQEKGSAMGTRWPAVTHAQGSELPAFTTLEASQMWGLVGTRARANFGALKKS